ncbi:MAG: hypothetical protein CMO01_15240 [Thalassobius sp.]|nr:hypothetical protein [Thalassovita sp.]
MHLREKLLPTATEDRILRILGLIKEIENNIDSGKSTENLIVRFNKITQRNYDREYFQTYWSSQSIEDFAREASQPLPEKIEDITKEELIEIVNRIRNGDENTTFYLELLDRNLPHPRISDLIFYPESEGLTDESTSEEIVEKAKAFRAIQL